MKTLCALCISREQGKENSNARNFNTGVCTSNNVAAAGVLVKIVTEMFEKKKSKDADS